MSPVTIQHINDFRKTDDQADMVVNSNVYIGRVPRLNLARVRLVQGQFVGPGSDFPAEKIKDSGIFRSYERIECFDVIPKDGLTTLLLNFSDLLFSPDVTICVGQTVI